MKLKICFVAHFARRAVVGTSHGHIGGVERQTNLMARWLVERGHEVSVIVWGEQDDPKEWEVDGIRVIPLCPMSEGIPGIRFFVPRWTSLISALRRADAEIYYQNCAEYVTGQVAIWARLASRRFVYSVASEPDCDYRLPTMHTVRERVLYRYGLKHADRVIVQTQVQKDMLAQGFQRQSTVLPMPCQDLPISEASDVQNCGERVVWIGRLAPVKRPEMIAEIAAHCPEFEFDIVGPSGGSSEYTESVRKAISGCKNAAMLGAADYSTVRQYYERSALLLCTSDYEGFPNTFLEAWSCGCPVVSTVDPDGVIQRHGLGLYSRDVGAIPDMIRKVAADRAAYSERCRAYFAENHQKDLAMRRFERIFLELTESPT